MSDPYYKPPSAVADFTRPGGFVDAALEEAPCDLPPFPQGPLLPPSDHERLRLHMAHMSLVPPTERRRGVDRRGPGRPRTRPDRRQQTVHVKLPADLHDGLCRAALRRDMAVNAILRELVERAAAAGEL